MSESREVIISQTEFTHATVGPRHCEREVLDVIVGEIKSCEVREFGNVPRDLLKLIV